MRKLPTLTNPSAMTLITPSVGRIPLRRHPRLRTTKLHSHRLDQHRNLRLRKNRRMGKTRTRPNTPRLLLLHLLHLRPQRRKAMEKFLHQTLEKH
jgi:hypothetical protein